MDKAKKEALQELLRLLADNPDLADRITIPSNLTASPSRANAKRPNPGARGSGKAPLPLSIKRRV